MSSDPLSPSRGVFFSFEGIDGSGKSTQARRLAAALNADGHSVVLIREPGGTLAGEQIRDLLLTPDAQITPRTEALLFAAARAQLVETVIEPALKAGQHVIADRYVDSTSAYQGAGRGLGDTIDTLTRFATAGRMPDRTYLVSVSLATASRRRSNRSADRMEQASDLFRERVAAAYERIAASEPERVCVLDGRATIPELHRAIYRDATQCIERLSC